MCDLCEQSEDGSMESCQDCGKLICFDVESDDDVIARAGVSSAGDLYCARCAAKHDEAELDSDEMADEWWDDLDDDPV